MQTHITTSTRLFSRPGRNSPIGEGPSFRTSLYCKKSTEKDRQHP